MAAQGAKAKALGSRGSGPRNGEVGKLGCWGSQAGMCANRCEGCWLVGSGME